MNFLHKLSGVFAVIKRKGITSAALTEKIRIKLLRELDIPFCGNGIGWLKVGHGGTLDIDAEGVLAIGIGDGCRHLGAFLHGEKRYTCVAQLGTATDTYNASGKMTESKPYNHITNVDVEKELKNFIGKTLQTPPKYSALKRGGVRLSDLERQGVCTPPPSPRPVWLHNIQCTNFTPPMLGLDIHCGGGFYVRSLVHDLGQALGSCCHVVDLQRTQHGDFTLSSALTEDEINLENVLAASHRSQKLHGMENQGKVPKISLKSKRKKR